MAWYRKKPIKIEAEFVASYLEMPRIAGWIVAGGGKAAYGQTDPGPAEICLSTPRGVERAFVGDYIIKEAEGVFYPCKADQFLATYQEA